MLSGLFLLGSSGAAVPLTQLNKAYIKGICIRTTWTAIETAQGVFDWSYLDTAVAAVPEGKEIALLIAMGGSIGSPAWLAGAGVVYFSYTVAGVVYSVPVPWDTVFMAKRDAFIQAVGARYAGNAKVTCMDVSAFTAQAGDFNLPSDSAVVQDLKNKGFTSAVAIAACTSAIDVAAAAFPGKDIQLSIGRLSSAYDAVNGPDYVCQQIVSYGQTTYPGRFIPQKSSLMTTTPASTDTKLFAWQTLKNGLPYTSAQFLWPAADVSSAQYAYRLNNYVPMSSADMLQATINKALSYPILKLEVYPSDIDQAWSDAILQAAADDIAALAALVEDVPIDPVTPVVPAPPVVVAQINVDYPESKPFAMPIRGRAFKIPVR